MPTTIVDAFKAATSNLEHAEMCRDSGCSLSLAQIPEPYVLLKVDSNNHPPPEVGSGKRCDFLFVGGSDEGKGPWIVPVELTTGRAKSVSDILAQLHGGLAVADARLPSGIKFQLCPVVAYGRGGLGSFTARNLRKSSNKVNFRNCRKPVVMVSCGSTLAAALKT